MFIISEASWIITFPQACSQILFFCQGVFLGILHEHESMKWVSHCICLMSRVPAAWYHWLATVCTPGTGSGYSVCHLWFLQSTCCLECCMLTHHCWVPQASFLTQVPSPPKGGPCPAVGHCYRIKIWFPCHKSKQLGSIFLTTVGLLGFTKVWLWSWSESPQFVSSHPDSHPTS